MYKYQEINAACPYAMPDELEYLREKALELNNESIVVVLGVGPFVMGTAMLEDHPDPPFVYGFDIAPLDYAYSHLKGAGIHLNSVILMLSDTSLAGEKWNIPIDLLVVDGDHEYVGVKADIEAWVPHVKVGGLVFFHDHLERIGGFNGEGPWKIGGVAQAIEECRDSSWVFIKQIGISVVYMKI